MNLSLGPGPLIGFVDEIYRLREDIEGTSRTTVRSSHTLKSD